MPGIEIDDAALAAFAAQHGIKRLAVFGSVLRPDFGPDSDIDLLVEFEPGPAPGLLSVAAMELELAGLIDARSSFGPTATSGLSSVTRCGSQPGRSMPTAPIRTTAT